MYDYYINVMESLVLTAHSIDKSLIGRGANPFALEMAYSNLYNNDLGEVISSKSKEIEKKCVINGIEEERSSDYIECLERANEYIKELLGSGVSQKVLEEQYSKENLNPNTQYTPS